MPKLSDIYGIDSNDFAQKVSSGALKNTDGGEEVWGGSRFDQSAKAKGNTPEFEDYDAKATNTNKGKDSRADSKDNH